MTLVFELCKVRIVSGSVQQRGKSRGNSGSQDLTSNIHKVHSLGALSHSIAQVRWSVPQRAAAAHKGFTWS